MSGLLVLFLIVGGKLQLATVKYDISCRFFLGSLYSRSSLLFLFFF